MYKQITSNKRKSIALLFGFLLLYGALGWLLSLWFGSAALFVALGVAIVMLFVNLFAGDDLITTVAGARRVERKEEAPELWRMVENLAITAGSADAAPVHRAPTRARTRSPPAAHRSRRSSRSPPGCWSGSTRRSWRESSPTR